MKRIYSVALALLITAVTFAAPAFAALRVPQVTLSPGGALQSQLDAADGAINASTQQQDIQRWRKTISGNSAMTLLIELGGNPDNNVIGVYNAVAEGGTAGQKFPIFPAAAEQGWFAMASFRTDSRLKVTLFDSFGGIVNTTTTDPVVNYEDFSYYIENGQTTGFAQDFLNAGGEARALVYSGTDANAGNWFLCFEDGLQPENASENQDFDEAILFLESVNPTPVARTSWGSLKARFR